MRIRIGYDLVFNFAAPTPMLLLLNTHPTEAQRLEGEDRPHTDPEIPVTEFIDSFGNRANRLVAPPGRVRFHNSVIAEDSGLPDRIRVDAPQHRIEDLPDECLPFLLGSRYCEVYEMTPIAWEMFGNAPAGWDRVQTVCDWVCDHITFGYKFARPTKTAPDVYHERTGVCRDFTHLAVTFCRALNIPARYCNGYLGDIGMPFDPAPMDFNAWFEVYLGGQWHTFDARHNEPRIGRVLMARGRDAVDIAMTTSFGSNTLEKFVVVTEEV